MPLSKIQTDILRLLAAHRDPENYVAGASPLNRDAPRISGDIGYAAVLTEQDISALDERIGQHHAKPPGKMVVAGTDETQRLVAAPARPIARRRSLRSNRHDSLQHLADQRGGEPEIAVAALLVNEQEPAFGQLAEMPAGSLRDTPPMATSAIDGWVPDMGQI